MTRALPCAVELHDLTKSFGDVLAVDEVSAVALPGEVTALLGPNGAGKTTTFRMLLGLVAPSSGTATFGGRRYDELTDPVRRVGAVLEASGCHPRAYRTGSPARPRDSVPAAQGRADAPPGRDRARRGRLCASRRASPASIPTCRIWRSPNGRRTHLSWQRTAPGRTPPSRLAGNQRGLRREPRRRSRPAPDPAGELPADSVPATAASGHSRPEAASPGDRRSPARSATVEAIPGHRRRAWLLPGRSRAERISHRHLGSREWHRKPGPWL